jgi:hypothetical protein
MVCSEISALNLLVMTKIVVNYLMILQISGS